MNDQAVKLIEELAKSLGTTSKYLWSILLKQAPISGAIDFLIFGCLSLGVYIIWRIHLILMSTPEDSHNSYYEEYEYAGIIMVVFCAIYMIFWIISLISTINSITCFVNPEYWALEQILNAVSKTCK